MAAMGIGVSCSCGFGASVPEPFAGQKVLRPKCEAARRVTAGPAPKENPETQRRLRQIAEAARVTEAERTAAPAFRPGLIGIRGIIECATLPTRPVTGKPYRETTREAWKLQKKDDAGCRNALDNTE